MSTDGSFEQMRPLLAQVAGKMLTFEGLRQLLLTHGAPDPYVVSPGGGDVSAAVLELLDPQRPHGDVERAYVALSRGLASYPEVAAARLGQTAGGKHKQGALEALLRARNDVFARWHEFQFEMQRVGVTVCQIRIDGDSIGSGFLVSDRHVLTAFHCVEELVIDGKADPGSHKRLTVTFDDVVIPGKPRSIYRTDVAVPADWLVAFSPQAQGENEAEAPLDEIDASCLDYALIRLAEPAGRLAPKYQPTPRRWLDLKQLAKEPAADSQVLIAHHPGGADLRLSVGLIRDHCKQSHRVRYLAPTIAASSGAPCFSIEWKPYALHNAGYEEVPVNQGVPLQLIWSAMGGDAVLVSSREEPELIPPVTADGEPVLSRKDIAEKVKQMMSGETAARAINVVASAEGGRTYTAELIRALVTDAGHKAFVLSGEKYATDTPEVFGNRLVSEIRVGAAAVEMPAMPDSRQRARWVVKKLSEWVSNGLGDAADTPAGERTIWLIFDDCIDAKFGAETQDLLLALIAHEAESGDRPLKFVFFDYGGSFTAIPAHLVWSTRLELLAAPAVAPFMRHVLNSLDAAESEDTLMEAAQDYVTNVRNLGISSLPPLIKGLKGWRDQREKKHAQGAGGGG